MTYGVRLLQLLRNAGVQTHLVMSRTAEITFAYETTLKIADVKALAHTTHSIDDMAAPISSGSFRTMGMIVAPCSMRSMSEISSGVTTTLLTRAADVTLKERRKLVLLVRETPLRVTASLPVAVRRRSQLLRSGDALWLAGVGATSVFFIGNLSSLAHQVSRFAAGRRRESSCSPQRCATPTSIPKRSRARPTV